jgi:hypothetical protein
MEENLIGYLLRALDPEAQRQTEEYLRTHPDAAAQLERLRAALAPLEADRREFDPPADLFERTIAGVAEHACRDGARLETADDARFPSAAAEAVLLDPPRWVPPAAARLRNRFVPPRGESEGGAPTWRARDLLVAAAILVLTVGSLLSGVSLLHQKRDLLACQNNLRQLHAALASYSELNGGSFPVVAETPPNDRAGSFVHLLAAAGLIDGRPAVCPAVFAPQADRSDPVGYAYTLGYRDDQCQLRGLRRDPRLPDNDQLPILADDPPPRPGHRTGQNVLLINGQVRFCTHANVGVAGDDIYLNLAGQVGAGLHGYDTVLGSSTARP